MQHQSQEFRRRLEQMLESCSLPADLAAEIDDHLIQVTYEKGAVIFLRGAPCDLVFWLLKGFVKLYLPHDDGTRTLVDLARSGDFLGFVNDRDSKGRRHLLEAHALTKCSVGLFTRDQIALMLSKLERTGTIHLFEQLNVAWSTMFERYVSFLGSPFRRRLEMVLNSLGDRFGIDDTRGTLLALELSQEDLAEMIGSSRPMVSKLIGEMIQEGLLARAEKRHFILRSKHENSMAGPDEIRSPVRWNRELKQAANTQLYTGARPSTNVPFPTPKRSVQPPA